MKAYLLLPRLDRRDAMANDAMAMQERLLALGWDATILCAGGAMRSRFRKLSSGWLQKAEADDLLVYHYGIAWEAGDDFFRAFPGKKVLRYHNVTPPEFYEPYHSGIARACQEGLRRVALLDADVAWCVSDYNVRSLMATGWKGKALTLPPFHRIEEILAEPLNLRKLKRQLKSRKTRNHGKFWKNSDLPQELNGDQRSSPEDSQSAQLQSPSSHGLVHSSERFQDPLNLLFLGREVPNKSIPETISMLDRALGKVGRKAYLQLVGSTDPALKQYTVEIDAAARAARNLIVKRAGSLDEKALKAELLLSDALVHFSLHEGFCIPLLEAMALGVPVVAARSEAMRDTLSSDAFLEFEEDPISRRLEALGSDSAEIAELLRQGLARYARYFHPEVIGQRMQRLLDELYSGGHQSEHTAPEEDPSTDFPDLAGRGMAHSSRPADQARGSLPSTATGSDIAIVVVRFGQEFAGGSEREALEYARLLQDAGDRITVLTSCARNAVSWANEYPEGEFIEDGVRIVRFPALRERNPYWRKLDGIMRKEGWRSQWASRPALSLEWIRAQGPFVPGLPAYLRQSSFHRLIFMTYLYYPSVYGAAVSAPEKSFLVPTLHDEAPARLGAIRLASRFHQNILWNTDEEALLGQTLWKVRGGTMVGAPVTTAGRSRKPGERNASGEAAIDSGKPVFLYIGRWDAGKGTAAMMALLREYTSIRSFRLRILGSGSAAGLPGFAEHLGFVSEEEKQLELASCTALIVPSEMESFSIVTLEAMAAETPVIVNGRNPVLAGHCRRANCGIVYHNAAEFLEGLERAVQGLSRETLEAGRRYVETHYSRDAVRNRLLQALDL